MRYTTFVKSNFILLIVMLIESEVHTSPNTKQRTNTIFGIFNARNNTRIYAISSHHRPIVFSPFKFHLLRAFPIQNAEN